MSGELQSLRLKVESLADEAGEARARLLNCLDVADRHPADALSLARGTAETLTKQVLVAIGIKAPAVLDACLRELEKPETMSRALVPAEIITMLHKVRTIGNKALHDDLRIKVTTDDVESVLRDVLRVVRWYFGEFARGPRLDTVFRPAFVAGRQPLTSLEKRVLLELLKLYKMNTGAVVSPVNLVKAVKLDAETGELVLNNLREQQLLLVYEDPNRGNYQLLRLSPLGVQQAFDLEAD